MPRPPTHTRAGEQNPNQNQTRCSTWGSSICARECAERMWKKHRPECRRLQAVTFGEEYARNDDHGYRMLSWLPMTVNCGPYRS